MFGRFRHDGQSFGRVFMVRMVLIVGQTLAILFEQQFVLRQTLNGPQQVVADAQTVASRLGLEFGDDRLKGFETKLKTNAQCFPPMLT